MLFTDIIRRKRDGGALSDEQIRFFVNGLADESLPAEQVSFGASSLLQEPVGVMTTGEIPKSTLPAPTSRMAVPTSRTSTPVGRGSAARARCAASAASRKPSPRSSSVSASSVGSSSAAKRSSRSASSRRPRRRSAIQPREAARPAGRRHLFAGAAAGKRQALAQQPLQHGLIGVGAPALVDHRAVPFEAEGIEGAQDVVGGPGDFAGAVQVLHAQQPSAVPGAGVQITTEGGDQGAEVQVAGGGRGEAAPVFVGRHGAKKAGTGPALCWVGAAGPQPIWRSLISSSVLQSMHCVAVGRASRRRIPISTPQDSQ